jgi:hypothetical protein
MHQTDIASSRRKAELANPRFAHNKFCLGPVNALLIETVPVAQRSAASAVTVICANGLSNVISADLIGAISDRADLRVGMLVAPVAFVL